MQLLGAEEILLLFRKATQPIDLISLDFAHVLKRLILCQQDVDLTLKLSVLVSYFSSFLLSFQKLVFDLCDSTLVTVTNTLKFSFVAMLELIANFFVGFSRLSNHLLEFDNDLFPFLQFSCVIFFLAQKQALQFAFLVSGLVNDQVGLRLELPHLRLKIANFLVKSCFEIVALGVFQLELLLQIVHLQLVVI